METKISTIFLNIIDGKSVIEHYEDEEILYEGDYNIITQNLDIAKGKLMEITGCPPFLMFIYCYSSQKNEAIKILETRFNKYMESKTHPI